MNKSEELLNRIHEQNELAKKSVSEGKGEVGIFWVYKNEIILPHGVPFDSGELFGDFYTYPLDHYSVWEKGKRYLEDKNLKIMEYDEVHRGRIVYNIDKRTFTVYLGKDLVGNKTILYKIFSEFNLSSANTIVKTDEHYELY